jgi:hypothetical protein
MEARFDPIGKARARRRLLDLIPEPDDALRAAAHAAMVRSGVSAETIAILEQAHGGPRSGKDKT